MTEVWWCYLHSQSPSECKMNYCRMRANDPSYANFGAEPHVTEMLNVWQAMGSNRTWEGPV